MNLSAQRLRERLLRHLAVTMIVALGSLQVETALHAGEHESLEAADPCGVCLQLEQHDDAVADTPAVLTLALGAAPDTIQISQSVVSAAPRAFSARAPPLT